MQIEYCAFCRNRLSELEFTSGRAVWLAREPYCRPCAEKLANEAPAPGAARPTASTTCRISSHSIKPSGSSRIGSGVRHPAQSASGSGSAMLTAGGARWTAQAPGAHASGPRNPTPGLHLQNGAGLHPRRTPRPAPAVTPPAPSTTAWVPLLGILIGLAAGLAGIALFILQ